jgi:hypothetical protein
MRLPLIVIACVLAGCRSETSEATAKPIGDERPTPNRAVPNLSEPPRDMISIAGGPFRGSNLLCEPGTLKPIYGDIGPQPERVPLNVKSFAIDRDVVSCFQMERCIETGKCVSEGRPSYHCENGVAIVIRAVAAQFCAWRGMELPTYFQWQRAARGVDGRVFPDGAYSPRCDRADPSDDREHRCREISPDGLRYTTSDAHNELVRDIDCLYMGDSVASSPPPRFSPLKVLLQLRRLDIAVNGDYPGQFRCVDEAQP